MNTLPKSRLLRFVERTVVPARRAVARFSTRYSRKRFTLRHHVVLLCLKVKETTTYRDLVDELIEMPRIRDGLSLDAIPAPSTLCKAFDRLEMAVWWVLLNVSLAGLPVTGVTGVDASGFERAHASTHTVGQKYARTERGWTTGQQIDIRTGSTGQLPPTVSLHEANEPHYPVAQDDATGRYRDRHRSRHPRDDNTEIRYADRATDSETECNVHRGVDR